MTVGRQDLMVHPIEWHLLAPLYEQRHRIYHDLQHVHSIIRRIGQFDGLTPDQACWLEAVTWIHDAYYDPMAQQGVNERRSVDLLLGPLGKCFTPAGLALARKTVEATANHLEDQENIPALMGLFLDLDLANLSDSLNEFSDQSIRVSQELLEAGVPELLVIESQKRFAEHMLDRKKIYYSSVFQGRERDARQNLRALYETPAAFLPEGLFSTSPITPRP